MCRFRIEGWVLAAAACVYFAGLLAAQQPKASQLQKVSSKSAEKKVALVGSSRVSTDSALRDAAKREATKPSQQKAGESSEDAVLEFHPAASDAPTANSSAVGGRDGKKSPLRNVHGTAYGSTDAKGPQGRLTGGAVGASSKSGKTAIYVDTERSRAAPPR